MAIPPTSTDPAASASHGEDLPNPLDFNVEPALYLWVGPAIAVATTVTMLAVAGTGVYGAFRLARYFRSRAR